MYVSVYMYPFSLDIFFLLGLHSDLFPPQELTSLAGYYPVDESCSQATLHFWEELIVSTF